MDGRLSTPRRRDKGLRQTASSCVTTPTSTRSTVAVPAAASSTARSPFVEVTAVHDRRVESTSRSAGARARPDGRFGKWTPKHASRSAEPILGVPIRCGERLARVPATDVTDRSRARGPLGVTSRPAPRHRELVRVNPETTGRSLMRRVPQVMTVASIRDRCRSPSCTTLRPTPSVRQSFRRLTSSTRRPPGGSTVARARDSAVRRPFSNAGARHRARDDGLRCRIR